MIASFITVGADTHKYGIGKNQYVRLVGMGQGKNVTTIMYV